MESSSSLSQESYVKSESDESERNQVFAQSKERSLSLEIQLKDDLPFSYLKRGVYSQKLESFSFLS